MNIIKSFIELIRRLDGNKPKSQPKEKTQATQTSNQPDRQLKTSEKERYTGKDRVKYEEWISDTNETNPDGTQRQSILSKCEVGDSLTFKVFETKEEYLYLEVWTAHGCIGNVHNFDTLQTFARYVKNGGVVHDAKIAMIKHPKTSRGKISCKITFERNKMR